MKNISNLIYTIFITIIAFVGCSSRIPNGSTENNGPNIQNSTDIEYIESLDELDAATESFELSTVFEPIKPRAQVNQPVTTSLNITPPALVIWYVIDCLRFDHLPIGGYTRNTAPIIGQIASEGTTFTRCFSNGNCTLYSVSSMLPGVYSPLYKPTKEQMYIPDNLLMVSDYLKQFDTWSTYIISENPYVSNYNGLDKGFDYYAMSHRKTLHAAWQPGPKTSFNEKSKAKLSELTLIAMNLLLQDKQDNPTFVYIHTLEPHLPYAAPERFYQELSVLKPFDSPGLKENLDYYDVGIRFADHNLGLLIENLKRLGIYEDTLLIVTSDHGEALLPHEHLGKAGHGGLPEPAKTHVPLIIRWPKLVPKNKHIDTNICSLDILPTLMDLIGYPIPDTINGKSLVPLMNGESTVGFEERKIFLTGSNYRMPIKEGEGADSHAVVYKKNYLISDPLRSNLYTLLSLAKDVDVSVPVMEQNIKDVLMKDLSQHITVQRNMYTSIFNSQTNEVPEMDEAQQSALEALGYFN